MSISVTVETRPELVSRFLHQMDGGDVFELKGELWMTGNRIDKVDGKNLHVCIRLGDGFMKGIDPETQVVPMLRPGQVIVLSKDVWW